MKMRPSLETAQIITEKKTLYCRAIDTHRWETLNKVMLPDVKWKVVNADGSPRREGMFSNSFSSRDEFVAQFSKRFETLQSIHVIGPAEIEQVSLDEIRTIFASCWSIGPKAESDGSHSHGGGHYYDVWKRVEDDWLMSELVFESAYQAPVRQ